MRGAGEGNFTPSQRRRPLGAMVEGKEILNSTLTTYEATERLRLDDDDSRLFTTRLYSVVVVVVLSLCWQFPRPYPPLPSIPTNSPYIPPPRSPPLLSKYV